MAGSINKVTLMGNLGRDPEVRYSRDGGKIVNFSVATSERWKDSNTGDQREKTEWHRVVIFNDRLADVAEQYLRKGSKVYVEGGLQTRKWTGNDGQERYSTEIVLQKFRGELVMLDSRGGGMNDGYIPPGNAAPGDNDVNPDWNSPPSGGGGGGNAPAPGGGRNAPAPGGGGNAPAPGGNLDDEIPF